MQRFLELTTVLSVCASGALGQPLGDEWDTTVGTPGIASGYVGAFEVFDDGSGEQLYAGGSFSSFTGVPSTSLVARWDRVAQVWSDVGGGLDKGSSNAFVTSFAPYDSGAGLELVVGGEFEGAFGVPDTTNLATWDGSSWSSLNANITGSVWSLATWDDGGGERLFVGGSFPTAGGVSANGIAAWDGTQWASLGSGITGSFNPYVAVMKVFDDGSGEKLYVGGRFDTMDGLGTPLVARWDGTAWEQIGSGLINDSSLFGIESMEIHDDGSGPALFVGGRHFHAPGQPSANVSRWDGQQWTTIGAQQSGRVTTLRTFDDGGGEGLYLGGNALPDLEYFARLEGGQWQAAGGGVANDPAPPWPSVFALYAWDDELYVGGVYNRAGGQFPCSGIAVWGCPGLRLRATPAAPQPGETLDLLSFRGWPSGLVMLRVKSIDGNPLVLRVGRLARFQADGTWTVSGTVPPGLSGLEVGFASLGFVSASELQESNEAIVDFL